MNKKMTTLMRSALAASLLLTSPGLASYAAAADTVSFKLPARIAVVPIVDTAVKTPVLTTNLTAGIDTRVGEMANVPASAATAATFGDGTVVPTIPGVQIPAALVSPEGRPIEIKAPNPAEPGALIETQKPEAGTPQASEASGSRWSGLFDLMTRRRGLSEAPAQTLSVAGRFSAAPSGLTRTAGTTGFQRTTLPRPSYASASRGSARVGTLVAIAALAFLALPALALAAPVAAAAAPVVASVSLISSLHPIATALTAAGGAFYGLIAAQKKEEGAAGMGEALVSMIKYGVLAGSGTYLLLGLTQGLFLGFSSVALSPLPSAVATGALGASAFTGKFTDPTSTPAERIMGAFPAVAAALGLSVGVAAFTTLSVPLAVALGAMSISGVAAAVYSAIYKPGKSSADGAAAMGRGFVLQSLMGGLALTLSDPYLALPLAALSAWGFWDVLSTTLGEAGSQLLANPAVKHIWERIKAYFDLRKK